MTRSALFAVGRPAWSGVLGIAQSRATAAEDNIKLETSALLSGHIPQFTPAFLL